MSDFLRYQEPAWADVLKDESLLDDFISSYYEENRFLKNPAMIGEKAEQVIRKRYWEDRERMEREGLSAEEIPDPDFP